MGSLSRRRKDETYGGRGNGDFRLGGSGWMAPEEPEGQAREFGPMDTKKLLTAEEVAVLTGLAVETLAQWRSQRRGIPYLKIGRAVRYDASDVQQYLEGCRVSVSDPRERRWK